ncbi:sigma-70 family RNA polymerase sigma factor [Longispora sp. K20-0274]|uniref:sigma-70 family RNA polymerase sigma factor n=1 Tax=Longispora sp. K20-0274 TaxID=3088255 RepID=UPI00399A395C
MGLRNAVVEEAIGLADALARRHAHSAENAEDLRQVARLALIGAVDRFDPDRGIGFAAFAIPTIVGEIKRYFRDRTWSVRVPRALQERLLQTRQATPMLTQRLGRTPTVGDLARHLGTSEQEIRDSLGCDTARTAVSLQTPVPSGELGDLLGTADPDLAMVDTRESLRPLLARLPNRERGILATRYDENLTNRRSPRASTCSRCTCLGC